MTFGAPNAPVTIEIYEDPLCPACGMFERSQGAAITAAINEQKLRVRFRTLNFLNDASASRDYSTRAGAALQCVAGEKNQDVFLKFHSALFEQQPQEQGSSDHSNEDLANIAGTAGASEDTQRCIVKGAQVESAQQAAQESVKKLQAASPGGVSTPSVLHNDTKIDHSNPNWLPQLLGGAQ
nr:thioredoxin domain-containing protein [Gordonia araii]